MIPIVTIMGLQFANLSCGTIVVENVFYLPGLGRLVFQAIANRDLIVVRDCRDAAGGAGRDRELRWSTCSTLAIDPRLKAADL